jgi:hypothetical protein
VTKKEIYSSILKGHIDR